MAYASLEDCINDLEKNGQLVRITEEVDPELEMAAIHLKVFEGNGPAMLFENVKGSSFRAVSNLFGNINRSKYIFRESFNIIPQLIGIKQNPAQAISQPFKSLSLAKHAVNALPKKISFSSTGFKEISIDQLPLIKHWPKDGGAFVTLPQVYTEDPDQPGIKHSNLGMYRIQLSGNDYVLNNEIGLHYQLHRGIGIHQTKANAKNQPLKVSVFVGGPPAHTVAAVMPLPEGMSELNFAGVLGSRRFRYAEHEGFTLSADADFVITGYVNPGENKPEGPFGDHLGYYSLQHPFPLMRVHKVYAKPNAIWPFTVVGRPPQEDTAFGNLIHELTGEALQSEIPGLKEVHAVDAAGVHPLLLAIGSERYTPYLTDQRPSEILTIANRVLGTGQLSLAKFLFIAAGNSKHEVPSTKDTEAFFKYMFERMDFSRDLHFQTQTSIDTLDYSGEGLNSGSKLVLAAFGEKKRNLLTKESYNQAMLLETGLHWVMPGVVSISLEKFDDYNHAEKEIQELEIKLKNRAGTFLNEIAMIIVCDDAKEVAAAANNFLWISFTRTNPSHDVYGIDSFTAHKHWGCKGPVILDARIKPFHAPALIKDPAVESRIERIFNKGGSLYNKI